ncbi:MAG: cytochrome c maturation protein CcmE [Acidimicrobiia bacterium]
MLSKRNRFLAISAVLLICIVAIVFMAIQGNVIYYYKVSEAVKKAESQGTKRFRLAGVVKTGSIKTFSGQTKFQVTDGEKTVDVIHRGDPPELFKDGAPVVSEGNWEKNKEGKVFESDRIMIKHGNEYKPPKVKQ